MMMYIQPSRTILLSLLLSACCSQESPLDYAFFNSPIQCGHTVTFEVSPTKGYLVLPDIAKDKNTKAFIECEMTFHSVREDGMLCISQEGRLSRIRDKNAELVVRDGYDDEHPGIFTLGYFPDEWNKREVCTTNPHLYFHLRKKDKGVKVNVKDINTKFKVLDIESHDRTLYLDDKFCDQTYRLKNSWVNVKDRLPSNFQELDYNGREKLYCGLKFQKEKEDGRRMCLVYIPAPIRNCSVEWELVVSTRHDITIRKDYEFTLLCSDPRARTRQVWCGSNSTDRYSVIINRTQVNEITSSKRFDLIVTDHEGSEADLLRAVHLALASSAPQDAGLGLVPVVIIILVALLAIVLIMFVVFKLRNKIYNPVERSEPTTV